MADLEVSRKRTIAFVVCLALVGAGIYTIATVSSHAGTSNSSTLARSQYPAYCTASMPGMTAAQMSAMPGCANASKSDSINSGGLPGLTTMDGYPMTPVSESTCSGIPTMGATIPGPGEKPFPIMEMQVVPTTPPTPAQVAAANELIGQTQAGIAKYKNIEVAKADGYVIPDELEATEAGPMQHWVSIAAFSAKQTINPDQPQSLLYARTPTGLVLLSAMYMTDNFCQAGPDIGGSLTIWHTHTQQCFTPNDAPWVVATVQDPLGTCPKGTEPHATPFMLHVWIVPNKFGPFADEIDVPSFEAATGMTVPTSDDAAPNGGLMPS